MGYYINPTDGSAKEQFLIEYAQEQPDTFKWEDLKDGELPLVWVFNGAFSAVGVAYDKREFEMFTDPSDDRPKTIYTALVEDILKATDDPESLQKRLEG